MINLLKDVLHNLDLRYIQDDLSIPPNICAIIEIVAETQSVAKELLKHIDNHTYGYYLCYQIARSLGEKHPEYNDLMSCEDVPFAMYVRIRWVEDMIYDVSYGQPLTPFYTRNELFDLYEEFQLKGN